MSNNPPKFLRISPKLLLVQAMLAALITIIVATSVGLTKINSTDWTMLLGFSVITVTIAALSVLLVTLCSGMVAKRSHSAGFLLALYLCACASLLVITVVLFFRLNQNQFGLIGLEKQVTFIVSTLMVSVLISALCLHYHDLSLSSAQERVKREEQQLQVLQSRIRPHFMFNSMNSVASLIGTNPEHAENLLEDLADVFRVLMADARKLVPLNAEIEISKRYLNIETARLGKRLMVEWNIEDRARVALVPTLTLQPLLENAVYHGIEPRFAGGKIEVDMWCEENQVIINITNPMPDIRSPRRKGNQIAQANVRERLARHFGPNAELRNTEGADQYIVRLRVPMTYHAQTSTHV